MSSEDENNRSQKHLWKNINKAKNKYTQDKQPHSHNISHSLDQAFNQARTPNHDDVIGEGIMKDRPHLDIDRFDQMLGDDTEQLKIQEEENQRNFMLRKSEVEEVLEFEDLEQQIQQKDVSADGANCGQRVETEEDQQMPMIISTDMDGFTRLKSKSFTLLRAQNRIRGQLRNLMNENKILKEVVRQGRQLILKDCQVASMMMIEHFEEFLSPIVADLKAARQERDENLEKILYLQQENQILLQKNEEMEENLYKSQQRPKESIEISIRLQEKQNKIRNLDKLNEELKNRVRSLETENDELSESIFDYEQKIAQLDLEIEKRVSKEVEKKMAEEQKKKKKEVKEVIVEEESFCHARKEDHLNECEYYKNEMTIMEKEIERMSEEFLNKKEILEIRQANLAEREDDLRYREKQIEQIVKQFQLKRLALERDHENLRRKEYELNFIEQQLKKRQLEVDEKSKEFYMQKEIEEKSLSLRRKKFDANLSGDIDYILNDSHSKGFHHPHQMTDVKSYRFRSDAVEGAPRMPVSKKYGDISSTGYKHQSTSSNNYHSYKPINGISNKNYRSSSRSGDKEKKSFEISNSVGKGFVGSSKSNYRGSSVVGNSFNKNRSNVNPVDSSRLQNLGNKLEKLREEIRKEIKDVS